TTTITRTTYTLAGQPIAIEVEGDLDEQNNGLFYIHSDHLGSLSALTDEEGNLHSQTTFYPFGSYRNSTGHTVTDRGYTGHRHNDDLGLIYMNARYYLPGIGRFVSADTIVPNPADPQSFNRYSYTLNNPLRYTDPTGHCTGDPRGVGNTRQENDCWRLVATIDAQWDEWWEQSYGS